MKQSLKGSLGCLLAALIWGTAFVFQASGMDHIGPFTFMFWRCVAAAAVLGPASCISARLGRRPGARRAAPALPAWKVGLVCGSVMFLSVSLQQVGLLYTSVGKSGFITALYVVLVPLTGLFFGKKPPLLLWCCVALAAAALWLLCMGGGFGAVNRGDVLTLGCAAAFTCHILVLDRFAADHDPILLSFLQVVVAGAFSLLPALALETASAADILAAAPAFLFVGVLSSGVAYTLQIWAQRTTDPTVCSLLFCLEGVFSVLAGWLLLHQRLSGRELAGCGVMFAAILLAQLPAARPKTQ